MKSLSSEDRHNLTQKSDYPGLVHLSLHWGLVIIGAALIYLSVPGWWLLLPVQGIVIIFLFTLLHETVHDTPFASPFFNRLAGSVSGFLIFLPPTWFRYFHLAHHRHTHNPEHDPELASTKPETVAQYVRHVSGIPIWISQIKTLLKNALGTFDDEFVPHKARRKVISEARFMLMIYFALVLVSIFLDSTTLIWIWLIPLALGQPFLRFYLLAEHSRCAHVADMFENTRTTFTNSIVRWLAWNMPYHAEHHAMPTVPFHKLPRLHQLSREHLKEVEGGYARFNQNYVGSLKRLADE